MHVNADSGINDFDFLLGHWRVQNYRLVKRLQDNDDWENFPATQHNRALPGRVGNIDDFIADTCDLDLSGFRYGC